MSAKLTSSGTRNDKLACLSGGTMRVCTANKKNLFPDKTSRCPILEGGLLHIGEVVAHSKLSGMPESRVMS